VVHAVVRGERLLRGELVSGALVIRIWWIAPVPAGTACWVSLLRGGGLGGSGKAGWGFVGFGHTVGS
jgi:hypothetical protein